MNKVVLLIVGLFFAVQAQAAESITLESSVTKYRLEVLVHSSQLRLVEIKGCDEEVIGLFPVGTSKYDKPITYNTELAVEYILINPPWNPTRNMLNAEQEKIAAGKKIPSPLRAYKPAEKGNPLGFLAIYPEQKSGSMLRIHDTFKPIGKKNLPDGSVKGSRISGGCARAEMETLLPIATVLTEKDADKITHLIESKKTHRLDVKHQVTMIFIPS